MAMASEPIRAAILNDLRDQSGKSWKGNLNDLPQSIPEDLRKSLQAHLQAKKSVTIHQNERGDKVLHWIDRQDYLDTVRERPSIKDFRRWFNNADNLYNTALGCPSRYFIKVIHISADGKVETQSLQINN
jgi:hypothetical protein